MLVAHEVNALNLLNNPRVGWDILLVRRRLEVSLDLLGGPCHLIFFAGIVLLVVGRAIFVGRLRFLIIQRLLLVFERPSTSLVALHLLVPVVGRLVRIDRQRTWTSRPTPLASISFVGARGRFADMTAAIEWRPQAQRQYGGSASKRR
jgi:hypothetical protein